MPETVNITQKKAALYIRVSTQFQVDKDSLQVQRRELEAYTELVLGIREHEVFEDPGYSGKDTMRPALQRMMVRLRMGEFSHLVVWKIDRISRNLLDFASMYAELKKLGITFVSKNEQFDTSTAIGEAMLKIILVFAELERQMTAERVTAVMLSRANNGQWNGGRVPYGYDWDPKAKLFTVNENEADAYRFMCSQYEEKQSLLRVCDEMNSRGIPTKTGGQWNAVGVHKILTSVFYKGVYRYNVHSDGRGVKKRDSSEWVEIEGHHPALIDDERFDRIVRMLKKNVRKGPKRGDTYTGKAIHIFSGLIVCGNCGANMTATKDKRRADGFRPSIYGCASRRKKKNCGNRYVSDLVVAPAVFALIAGVLNARNDPDGIEKSVRAHGCMKEVRRIEGLDRFAAALKSGATGLEYVPPEGTAADEFAALKLRKKQCETSLKRLQSLYLYKESAMPMKEYLSERKRITDELEQIDALLPDEEEEEVTERDFTRKASYFLMVDRLLGGHADDTDKLIRSLDPAVPKAFLNTVLDHITVTDGIVTAVTFRNKITVRFIR